MPISSEPTDLRDKDMILWRLREEKLQWGQHSSRRGQKWIIQDEVAYFAGKTKAENVYVDMPTLREMSKDGLVELKQTSHICGDNWAQHAGEISKARKRRHKIRGENVRDLRKKHRSRSRRSNAPNPSARGTPK